MLASRASRQVPQNPLRHLPTHALGHRLEQATQADIKKVYRKLSQTYHPDVNQEPGAQERFIEISQAYSILGDDEERYVLYTCVSAHIEGC